MLRFGPISIERAHCFAESAFSFAFVNLKPVVPGHVLVSPKRVAPRFSDLDSKEVADLWALAQRVGSKVEGHYKAKALTFTIQDGPAAGQSIPHVHVHVLPRREGDFEPNDAVYDAIDKASEKMSGGPETLNLDKERVARTPEVMAAEAAELRSMFEHDPADP